MPSDDDHYEGGHEVSFHQHSFTTHHTITTMNKSDSFCHHRLPALLAAGLSSAAVLLAAFAGTSCDFLQVSTIPADPPNFLLAPDGAEGYVATNLEQASIGIVCNDGNSESLSFYDRDGDSMWNLSRVFWIVGLTLGSITATLAWAVCIFGTQRVWKSVSIVAALAAVLQVPVFVLFESEPCQAFANTQQCSMGQGAFLLIASDILLIAVCLCTQCLDPPQEPLQFGKDKEVTPSYYYNTSYRNHDNKKRSDYYDYDSDDDNDRVNLWVRHGSDDNEEGSDGEGMYHITRILPASKKYQDEKDVKKSGKKKNGGLMSWFSSSSKKEKTSSYNKKSLADDLTDLGLPQIETESTKDQEDDDYADFDGLHKQLDDSQVILRVLPEQKAPISTKNEVASDVAAQDDIETGKGGSETSEKQDWADSGEWGGGEGELPYDNTTVGDSTIGKIVRSASATAEEDRQHNRSFSSNDILADLKVVEGVSAAVAAASSTEPDPIISATQSNDGDVVKPPCTSSDKLLLGVRSLTKKLKRDSKSKQQKKKKTRARTVAIGRAAGYATLDDEAEYDSDEGAAKTLNTPPLELKLPVVDKSAESNDADNEKSTAAPDENGMFADSGIQFQMPDFSDDDEDDIFMENGSWQGMAAATSAGIRKAADGLEDDENPFGTARSSGGSYHSDPEPVYHESESEGPELEGYCSFEDNSTLSDDHSGSRGRSSSSRDGRRKRAASPVESIKSHRSLLYTTINEETEEEIKRELDTAYSLTRTTSAPEPRSNARGGIVTRSRQVDLVKTLDTRSYNPNIIHRDNEDDVDEGDIPMLTTRQPLNQTNPLATDDSEGIPDDSSRPMDEDTEDESELDIKPMVVPDSLLGPTVNDSMESSPSRHTWKEPDLPTKKIWKDPNSDGKDTIESTSPTKTWKDPSLYSDPKWRDVLESRATNTSDATSDTDLSRTTDSFSEDSGNEDGGGRRRIILRSRSFGNSASKSKKSSVSRSLSPSRSGRLRKFMSMAEGSSQSGRARDIRSLRLQRLKGYSPLKDEMGTPPRPGSGTPSEELTPKRKTHREAMDEKKEDEAIYGGEPLSLDTLSDLPSDLMMPHTLSPAKQIPRVVSQDDDSAYVQESDMESPEFDSMLEDLDLQLIDLRRPVGAEYGDDEESL